MLQSPYLSKTQHNITLLSGKDWWAHEPSHCSLCLLKVRFDSSKGSRTWRDLVLGHEWVLKVGRTGGPETPSHFETPVVWRYGKLWLRITPMTFNFNMIIGTSWPQSSTFHQLLLPLAWLPPRINLAYPKGFFGKSAVDFQAPGCHGMYLAWFCKRFWTNCNKTVASWIVSGFPFMFPIVTHRVFTVYR